MTTTETDRPYDHSPDPTDIALEIANAGRPLRPEVPASDNDTSNTRDTRPSRRKPRHRYSGTTLATVAGLSLMAGGAIDHYDLPGKAVDAVVEFLEPDLASESTVFEVPEGGMSINDIIDSAYGRVNSAYRSSVIEDFIERNKDGVCANGACANGNVDTPGPVYVSTHFG